MNYQEAIMYKRHYEDAGENCSKELKKFPKGDMGLVPDHIRETEEYQIAKYACDAAFTRLQQYNQWFMKHYKMEYLAEKRKNRG